MITSRSMLCRSREHLETCFGRSMCSISWKGKLERWTCPWSHLWIAGPCPRRSPPKSVRQSPVQWPSASNRTKRPSYDKKKSSWRKCTKENCPTRCLEKKSTGHQKQKKNSFLHFMLFLSYHFFQYFPRKIGRFFLVGPRTSIND